MIGVFTSRTYAVANLVFSTDGPLLHQPLGRYLDLVRGAGVVLLVVFVAAVILWMMLVARWRSGR
jgi:hypothetical protein